MNWFQSDFKRFARPRVKQVAIGMAASLLLSALPALAQDRASSESPRVTLHADLQYARVDGQPLLLDLYIPDNVENPPLVVYIHGGSWRAGDRKRCHAQFLAEEGFALASINYRLTQTAIFPAQIHDCKGAVRWLRASAEKYGYDSRRIGVAGSSAGGHLAVLLGTSGGVDDLEGQTGGNLDRSSRVAAVVDYYGPTDFVLRGKTHPERANAPDSGTYQLLGGPANELTEMARRASAVTYVSPDDPPLLILHGDADKTVYLDQSQSIHESYTAAGLDVTLHVAPGGGHGGKQFYSGENRQRVVDFLNRHLRATESEPRP